MSSSIDMLVYAVASPPGPYFYLLSGRIPDLELLVAFAISNKYPPIGGAFKFCPSFLWNVGVHNATEWAYMLDRGLKPFI